MDVTPLLGHRTGIGRYVASLLAALTDRPQHDEGIDVRGVAFTVRRRRGLRDDLPETVTLAGPPMSARALQRLWSHAEFPPVTVLSGRVDVFHGTNFVLPPTGPAAGVVTIHDLSFLRTPHTVNRASLAYQDLVPRSLERATVVCTPSTSVAGELEETYGIDPARVLVTPLGVDAAWFRATPPDAGRRARLHLPQEYVVFSGSLEPRKNLPLLLDAYRRLCAAEPDWPPLVLLGPPGWGPALDLRGLPEGKVVLTGYLDDEDLRSVVAGARALVYPSVYEGFGLPPLEAFACGVPVVASDLAVTREVVGDDADLATLVPVGDADAMADALHRWVAGEQPAMAASNRRHHAAGFTWATTAERTTEAYRLALTAR